MKETPEGIQFEKVSQWLTQAIPELVTPLRFTLIAGGHSNLTYRFDDTEGKAYVLRRPPLGPVLQSAHDMAREHRIVSALQCSTVPVAPTVALCTNESVNDAPFYVMKYVPGLVLHNAKAAEQFPAGLRGDLGMRVIDVLVALHGLNPDSVGLGDLGRKQGYIARQLKRWNQQWQQTRTHDVPEMEEAAQRLQDEMPEQIGASIVHGDFRLGNMIVNHKNAVADISAVLDWELCTLGDPLADLGYLLNQWPDPDEPDAALYPSGCGGFASRQQLCDRYAALTSRDLTRINYYRAFSWWRLAAIGQGVYKRYLEGAMGAGRDIDLAVMKDSVSNRARTALRLLSLP